MHRSRSRAHRSSFTARAFAEDGKTPLANAVIFAYHTDKEGVYDKPGTPAHSWRLRGWAKTDAKGAFEFRTIKPGSYPASKNPAHVHFTIFSGNSRYHAGELQFADDKFIGAQERENSKKQGEFGSVRTVRHEGTTEHVDFNVKVESQPAILTVGSACPFASGSGGSVEFVRVRHKRDAHVDGGRRPVVPPFRPFDGDDRVAADHLVESEVG